MAQVPKDKLDWALSVLRIAPDDLAAFKEADLRYYFWEQSRKHHPDAAGGSSEKWIELLEARDIIKTYLGDGK